MLDVDSPGIEAQLGPPTGQVYTAVIDSRQRSRRPLDGGNTACAVHAAHVERGFDEVFWTKARGWCDGHCAAIIRATRVPGRVAASRCHAESFGRGSPGTGDHFMSATYLSGFFSKSLMQSLQQKPITLPL